MLLKNTKSQDKLKINSLFYHKRKPPKLKPKDYLKMKSSQLKFKLKIKMEKLKMLLLIKMKESEKQPWNN
jgi:hypothetical protein